ncbi:MAG: YjfB family protein [Cellulosilyticum sp.]|nr:YjfB family protein [Cellulosilyticum sp.]
MDIASLSMSLSAQELSTAVGLAITKLNMDTLEQSGNQLIENMKAMELSVNPHLGSQLDLSI